MNEAKQSVSSLLQQLTKFTGVVVIEINYFLWDLFEWT